MVEILGVNYINEKEASLRYNYSVSWFRTQRWKGEGPPYIKVNDGKVLYEIDLIDNWFKTHIRKCDDK